jgi:hypothetical protein
LRTTRHFEGKESITLRPNTANVRNIDALWQKEKAYNAKRIQELRGQFIAVRKSLSKFREQLEPVLKTLGLEIPPP